MRKRVKTKIITGLVAVLAILGFAQPAQAAMQGYDTSNWQCGINTASVPGDFVVVGSTWGTGQVNGNCLSHGVNTDANRQLSQAQAAGKKIGIYHYALGGDPVAEADFFVNNNLGWIRKAKLVLDWESVDNRAFGNTSWPRQWVSRVQQRTGVNPEIYVSDSAYWQVAGMEKTHNTGIWIAQYASNAVTGYQDHPWNGGARGEVMRQYSSSGKLPGWAGYLDIDIFYGDRAAWDKIANPGGKAVPSNPAPAPATPPLQPTQSTGSCQTARPGDTLSGIAARLGTSWQSLTGYRSGNPNVIYIGERICVGGQQVAHAAGGTYVVRSGDYLSKIWPGTWQQVAALNGLHPPYTIYPGQTLRTTGSAPRQAYRGGSYRIVRGDTLSGIAAKLGTSVQHLVQANGIHDQNRIYAGTWIRY